MSITTLPTPPSRSDQPADFISKADAFIASLPQFVTELNSLGTAYNLATSTTSTTSNTIGTGSKTFTVTSGLGFLVGMAVSVANSSSNYMFGIVTSYSGTSLVINITSVGGSGTFTSWTIALAASSSGASLGANTFAGSQTLGSTYAFNESISTLASATTPDIWTSQSNLINYTGTTTATGFAAAPQAGVRRTLICAGAAVFTAGSNMLIDGVASGSNFTAAAGDEITVEAVTTTQFRLRPKKYDGTAIVSTGRLLGTVYYSTPSQALTSISNANPAVFTVTNARLLPQNFSPVQFTTSGTLPTGLSLATTYYTFNCTGTTFNVATSMANAIAGTAVATSSAGSGTHTMAAAPYVKATGVFGIPSFIEIEVHGAGGGSGGATSTAGAVASGGGAGAWAYRRLAVAALGTSETLTIGDGGTAGANTGTNGGTGGTSSFGSFVTCTGGAGGIGSTANAIRAAASGGAATGGDLNCPGSPSFGVYATSVQVTAQGGLGHMNAGNEAIPQMLTTYAPASPPRNSGNGANGAKGEGTAQTGAIGGTGYIIVREYS